MCVLLGTCEQCRVLSAAARISKALILGLLPFSGEGNRTPSRGIFKLQPGWRCVGKDKMKSTSQLYTTAV